MGVAGRSIPHQRSGLIFFEGKVWLRGRATDQINVAGRKISPESIEKCYSLTRRWRDCLVFGIPSQGAERVEEIAACVVARAN